MPDGSDVLTASRLEIYLIGGASGLNTIVGLAQRLDITDNFNFIPLKGIGFQYTIDYVPGIYEGTGDLSTIRLLKQSLQEYGLAEHQSLVSQDNDRDMQLVVRSKKGDTIDILRKVRFNQVRSTIEVGSQILIEDAAIVFVRTIETV